MAITITSAQKNQSTKYPIILSVTETASSSRIQLQIFRGADVIYNSFILPLRQSGTDLNYELDISEILDSGIRYIYFGTGLSLPSTFEDAWTVRVASEIPILTDTWTAKFYKFRQDYYKYFHDVTESATGAEMPTSGLYPADLIAYKDLTNSSMLQVYTYVATEIVNIVWTFNTGDPDQPESLVIATPGNGFVSQLNIGLDELLEASLLIPRAQRHLIESYTIALDGGAVIHTVTVQNLDYCKLSAFTISYINEYGLWESFTCPARIRETLNPRKVGYRRAPKDVPLNIGGTFNPVEVLTPVIDYDYSKSYVVDTDWMNEAQMDQFKFAVTSDLAYTKINLPDSSGNLKGFVIPITITNQQVEVKQRVFDKVYSLQLTYVTQPQNK
tara:strand:- start:431 stop:1588 length:1158 start_codon:yes stop_codon:yes gene_type:complete